MQAEDPTWACTGCQEGHKGTAGLQDVMFRVWDLGVGVEGWACLQHGLEDLGVGLHDLAQALELGIAAQEVQGPRLSPSLGLHPPSSCQLEPEGQGFRV